MSFRSVEKVVLSRWQSEGRGAKVRRSIGGANLRLVAFLPSPSFVGSPRGGGLKSGESGGALGEQISG